MKTNKQTWQPLPREEVVKAIERKNPLRIPLVRAQWWGEGLEEQYGRKLDMLNRYPEDVSQLWTDPPIDYTKMGLSWELPLDEGAHDARPVIDDWSKLDEFIEKLPDPEKDPRFEGLLIEAEAARANDTYIT